MILLFFLMIARNIPSRFLQEIMSAQGQKSSTRRPSTKKERQIGPAIRISQPTVQIEEEGARWIRAGHPWVFRDSIRSCPSLSSSTKATILVIIDQKREVLGKGYWVEEGAIAVRVLTTDPDSKGKEEIVQKNLDRAMNLRKRLLSPDLTAFRVVHGDGDGLSGINVDRYGSFVVIHQLCKEAHFLTEEAAKRIGEKYGLKGVYLQKRFGPPIKGPSPGAQLAWGEAAGLSEEVSENGLRFQVDVTAPVNPGLFVDLRQARQRFGEMARSKNVLNCFSHTGAFTVYAAAKGADKVVSIDLSQRYHGWAKRNLALNGLDPKKHEFVAADTVSALTRMARRGSPFFDLAVVDPPTFSMGRKKGAMSLGRDYPEVMASVCSMMRQGGVLLACCNTARLSWADFSKLLASAGIKARRRLTLLGQASSGPDFPIPVGFLEGYPLKAAWLTVD